MGSFLAARTGDFRWDVMILACLTAILLQLLSNLANDYGDSIHGADSDLRKGPSRAVQSGMITADRMKRAIYLFAALALVSGVTLVIMASITVKMKLLFLGLGLVAIAAAYYYTNGARPYGYAGLGDISVFLFFGLLGVMGSYYLHTARWDQAVILPAVSVAAFSVGVLNVNNIRDMISDQKAGKYSVPVRLGYTGARVYHSLLILTGILAAMIYSGAAQGVWTTYLYAALLPIFFLHLRAIWSKDREQLDPQLKQLALLTFSFVILFGVGLLV